MLFLIDSSAVLNNFGFVFFSQNKYLITSKAFTELKDFRSKTLAENALHKKILSIQEPSDSTIKKTKDFLKQKGIKLSETDASILALGLELKQKDKKFVLISDDYSIQNSCAFLKIKFDSIIRGKIKQKRVFKKP